MLPRNPSSTGSPPMALPWLLVPAVFSVLLKPSSLLESVPLSVPQLVLCEYQIVLLEPVFQYYDLQFLRRQWHQTCGVLCVYYHTLLYIYVDLMKLFSIHRINSFYKLFCFWWNVIISICLIGCLLKLEIWYSKFQIS